MAGLARFRRMVAEIVTWLDRPHPEYIRERTLSWSPATWRTCFTTFWMHGIAAYLEHVLKQDDPAYGRLPENLEEYLRSYSHALAVSNRRILEELEAILHAASRGGVPLMPLKGSLMNVLYYDSPYLRPMADLDLLVKPEDEAALVGILETLGYASLAPDNPAARERHLRMLKPENMQVVSWDHPHPDNPRPVEIHTSIARMLWGNIRIEDASRGLWRSATHTTFLGQPAFIPARSALLAYMAIHATDHMALHTARAIQLVDLSLLSTDVAKLPEQAPADWVYPSLAVARRCLPSAWEGASLAELGRKADPTIARWAQRVPLDHRCGLVFDPTPPGRRSWQLHWERWWPSTWRLRLGYPEMTLSAASFRHAGAMLRQAARRISG